MTKPDRRNLAGLALAAALGLTALPASAETLAPAAKIFPFLKEYLSLSQAARDRFMPTYVLHAKAGQITGVRLWLVQDGRRTPLAVAADGQVSPPVRAADLAGAQIALSAPPGSKFGMRVEVVASVPSRADIPTAALEASLAQANSAMHTGVPLLGPPRMTRLIFPGAEEGELVSAGGQHTALPRAGGVAYYEPGPAGRGGVVHFRRPPTRIVLDSGR